MLFFVIFVVLFHSRATRRNLCYSAYSPINKKNMEKQFLTTKEAAAFLGYRVSYLYKLIMWRKLPHYKVGKGVRFLREDLVNYLTAERREAQV